jgi:hypothetical protein
MTDDAQNREIPPSKADLLSCPTLLVLIIHRVVRTASNNCDVNHHWKRIVNITGYTLQTRRFNDTDERVRHRDTEDQGI